MAVSMSWDESGLDGVVAEAMDEGLFEAAEVLLAHSNRLVPLDEGPLMNSGTAEVNNGVARVGYNTPYAYRQHEDLTYTHTDGRTAKYLERPLNEFQTEFEDILGSALERRLGS